MFTYQWPNGKVDQQTIAAAAVMAITVKNSKTQINITGAMAAAGTLNLTVNSRVPVGATLMVKAVSDGTGRTLTFGTGMTGKAFAITASKHVVFMFEWDGTKFQNTSAILTD